MPFFRIPALIFSISWIHSKPDVWRGSKCACFTSSCNWWDILIFWQRTIELWLTFKRRIFPSTLLIIERHYFQVWILDIASDHPPSPQRFLSSTRDSNACESQPLPISTSRRLCSWRTSWPIATISTSAVCDPWHWYPLRIHGLERHSSISDWTLLQT